MLTRELGFDAVTMDGVAARAGVGKATIYRRWKSKELLIADAVEAIVESVELPDTGTTRGDLRILMQDTLAMYRDPATAVLLSSLVSAMARSKPVARAVRRGFVSTRRNAMCEILRRGIQRGELAEHADLELAVDLLAAPLFYRLLATGARVDDALVRGVIDVVLRGLAPTQP